MEEVDYVTQVAKTLQHLTLCVLDAKKRCQPPKQKPYYPTLRETLVKAKNNKLLFSMTIKGN